MDTINIFWHRRDLRLDDNHGLYQALSDGKTLAIFIFDSNILESLARDDARVSFIHQYLKELHSELSTRGSCLRVYTGHPIEIWEKIIAQYSIKAVYVNEDYEPRAIKRDKEVKQLVESHNIAFKSFKDQVLFGKNDILKKDGLPYTVFTPYCRKWLTTLEESSIADYDSHSLLSNLVMESADYPTLTQIGFAPSSIKTKAINWRSLDRYNELRDFPYSDIGSYIGVHLRFGTISIRKAIKFARRTDSTWLSALIWREFFMQILYHYPRVVDRCFRSKYDLIHWRNDEAEFEAWCNGRTGYPLVDAGMRQLNRSGYMHNRVRMVCASFLCKHLLIDWRWGESYFASKLLDYDLAANNGNWQWAAGTGCDAAPYFRLFNPTLQLKKFDPNLRYVSTWIENLHQDSYPKPIIDHRLARERCLKTYKEALV